LNYGELLNLKRQKYDPSETEWAQSEIIALGFSQSEYNETYGSPLMDFVD
jgi:hypothetical protein